MHGVRGFRAKALFLEPGLLSTLILKLQILLALDFILDLLLDARILEHPRALPANVHKQVIAVLAAAFEPRASLDPLFGLLGLRTRLLGEELAFGVEVLEFGALGVGHFC